MLTYTTEEYSTFGKCLKLSNGHVYVYVTLEFGPRVISYGLEGHKNMLFEDSNRSFSVEGTAMDRHYYPGARWYLYGGHRLAVCPELVPQTYYPDNNPVEYITLCSTFQFTTKEPENGIEKSMTISMDETGPGLSLHHSVKNISNKSLVLAIWPITAVTPGGVAYACYGIDSHLPGMPNRDICLWPATDIRDKRLDIGNHVVILRHDPLATSAVKLGLTSQSGVCGYQVNGCLFLKKALYEPGEHVLDMGAMLELYSASHCVEMESLSPTYTLEPGETCKHTELWTLKAHELLPEVCNETEIVSLLDW